MEGKTDNGMTSKERIKKAWEENDLVALFKEGIDSFLSLLSQRPVPFETFLNEIGDQIDSRIPTLEKNSGGTFYGGTLTLQPLEGQNLELCAVLYSKAPDGQWSVTQMHTQARQAQISDWNTEPRLAPLRQGGKIEFPIDPPKKGMK